MESSAELLHVFGFAEEVGSESWLLVWPVVTFSSPGHLENFISVCSQVALEDRSVYMPQVHNSPPL